MAIYLNTNVSSLTAQNSLSSVTTYLSELYEELSTGYRINSAKDDAAGLQISNRMENQINGLTQANENANDGIALCQTVEGAMEEITSMYEAIRTLAVQAATGSVTDEDREALDQEVEAYSDEITRISEKTTYNGQTVLSGKDDDDTLLDAQGCISLQVGSDAYDYISVDLSEGYSVLQTAQQAINEYYEETTISVLSDENFYEMFGDSGYVYYGEDGTCYGVATDSEGNIYINQTCLDALDFTTGETYDGTEADAIEAIEALQAGEDVVEISDVMSYSQFILTINDVYALMNGADDETNSNNTLMGAIFGLHVTSSNGVATEAELDISTVANAQGCIEWCDNYIAVVDSKRAELGATQNRLESVISNQTNIITNTEDAQSRIQDTDYAEATSELASNSILQSYATAMLVQANDAQGDIVLQLLGD